MMTKMPLMPRLQKGMAGTLMIVLVGLGLTATALSLMYGLRGGQNAQVALHASTNAQQLAWTGLELARQSLLTQSPLTCPTTIGTTLYNSNSSSTKLTATTLNSPTDSNCTLVIKVTATIALNTPAQSSSTLLAILALVPTQTGSTNLGSPLTSGMTLNENITYSGGSLRLVNTSGNSLPASFYNFNITGTLNVSSGAQAIASGCAKKDITLTGGGVANNTTLLTEGNLTISSMSQPVNMSVGAKNIYISQSGGSYNYITSGAYQANVMSSSGNIGTAIVGGKLNGTTVIPRTTGTALITLTDGTIYHLDLSQATIESNGTVTTNNAGSLVSGTGTGTLPSSFTLTYTAIYGGTLNFLTGTVGTLWGNVVTLGGWSGTYTNLYANANMTMNTATITKMQGGADIYVRANGNLPTIQQASQIVGVVRNTDNSGAVYNGTIQNLTRNVSGASPGLPGVPVCEINIVPVNVTQYKEAANYVFYFDTTDSNNPIPMLKVQNVKASADNSSINGTYNLKTGDLRTLNNLPFMQCGWYNSYCLRTATPSTGWTLTGIYRFPPGMLYFEGNVTIDGVDSSQGSLYNGIISTGIIKLTSSGHVPLVAPNYASATTICNANFYPANLCDKSGSTPAFVTWTSNGTTYTGLPIGNIAIMTNTNLDVSGWTISGLVILGGGIATNGALVTIKGALSIGGNAASNASITAGGILVDVSNLTQSQIITPSSGGTASNTQKTWAITGTRYW